MPSGRTPKPMIVTLRQIMRQVSAATTLDDAAAILVRHREGADQDDVVRGALGDQRVDRRETAIVE